MRKILLNFPKIQEKLQNIFNNIPEDIQPEITDILLQKSNLSSEVLDRVEINLKIKLPNSFRNILLQYDLGNLTLGGIWFANGENYAQYLIEHNSEQYNYPWWGSGKRPLNHLLIAASDGYAIILDTKTEVILAFLHSESCQQVQLIASNFEVFLRAAATIFIEKESSDFEQLALDIAESVGCSTESNFWHEMIF